MPRVTLLASKSSCPVLISGMCCDILGDPKNPS